MIINVKKNMNKLIIIVTVFFTSCSITGTYFTGNRDIAHTLILKNDNKFIYKSFYDVGGAQPPINGEWTKNGNILTLNSNEQPDFKPNSIFDTLIQWDRNDKLIIFCNMDYVMSFTDNWIISINNGQEIDTLSGGFGVIYNSIYEKFKFIGYCGSVVYTTIDSIGSIKILNTRNWNDCILRDSVFYISNPKSNIIFIFPDPYNMYYGAEYMVHTEWKIKNRKIYFWRKENGKYAKDAYLKKRLRN